MTIDVIQLALEANIDLELHASIGREPVWIATQDELERFTALVMEEDAKVCDENAKRSERINNRLAHKVDAEAIRVRKPA